MPVLADRMSQLGTETAFEVLARANTLAAAGNEKYLKGFEPAMPGFDQVPFDDEADAIARALEANP